MRNASRDEVIAQVVSHAVNTTTPWTPASGKRFVVDVYQTIQRQGRDDGMSLEEFKDELYRLHRLGLVSLARADLVAAMPPAKVSASEIDAGPATFHFVIGPTPNAAPGFKEYIAKLKRQNADRVAELRAALSQSPAVLLTRDDFTELVIVTGDTHPSAGDRKLRATTFLHDGPWGHENYKDMDDVVSELARRSWKTVIPASDDEVQEWTSTPEFIEGSKRVAFAQAANALRYMAGREGYNSETYKRAQRILSDAEVMDDIDAATAKIEHELRAFDTERSQPSFVENPPWVTKALADAYETVSAKVPPAWLPKLTHVKSTHGGVTAKVKEYGCGKYGCVLPTLDPKIVLKVTSDDTEAQFAETYSPTLVDPVVVDYFAVVPLPDRHKGRPVYLLWRESAKYVGDVDTVVGPHAGNLIDIQHAAAADVLYLVMDKADRRHMDAALLVWLDTLEQIADEVPELASLARGMASIYRQQGVFIGDVHTGNLGMVKRDGKERWVITDPGNVIVFRK